MAAGRIEQEQREVGGGSAAGRLSALITGAFGALIVVGATRAWASLYLLETNVYQLKGTEIADDRGVITLGLGVAIIVMCSVRALWRIPDGGYVLVAGSAAAIVLATALWTVFDVPDDLNQEVLGVQVSEVRIASGAYLSLAGAVGCLVTLVMHYAFMRVRR